MAPSAPRRCSCATTKTEAEYVVEPRAVASGEQGTAGFRVHLVDGASGRRLSPWHSVPLFAGGAHGLVRMVCEIPRGSRVKMEVAVGEGGNPLKQDQKKGRLREYGVDMQWNYGMLPQTWEDPAHASLDCGGHMGDNDPVDVVDVGRHQPRPGAVYLLKPVAALAMIDEGELDWKVIGIAADDPRCSLVQDVGDMQQHFPGELDAIREWFRTYKTHEGKPLNRFELNEAYVNRQYTLDVIHQTHAFWKSLVLRSRSPEGSGKAVVGDAPILTSCFDPQAHRDGAAAQDVEGCAEEQDTVQWVLEAAMHEEKLSHSLHQLSLCPPPRLGA